MVVIVLLLVELAIDGNMLCTQPYVRDPTGKVFKTFDKNQFYKGIPFPCGHCLACRINRRRKWTLRLLLESMCYAVEDTAFFTLTYDDEHLHVSDTLGPVLWIDDVVNWIKRVRYYYPFIRYFIGGEYGEQTCRPHYHALLFGCSPVLSQHVAELWKCPSSGYLGHVHVGTQNTLDSIQYVAGYVSKKVGFPKKRPKEFREFCIQSRKPAIGMRMLPRLTEFIHSAKDLNGKVPLSLNVGNRTFPFDRTIANALYKTFTDDLDTNEFQYQQCINFFKAHQLYKDMGSKFGDLASMYIDESAQRNKQIKARCKIFNRGVL